MLKYAKYFRNEEFQRLSWSACSAWHNRTKSSNDARSYVNGDGAKEAIDSFWNSSVLQFLLVSNDQRRNQMKANPNKSLLIDSCSNGTLHEKPYFSSSGIS